MEKSPDAFRTISEVAEWLDTPAHVLRFWESRFTQVKPVKRAGGRRYYRPADMALLGGIKKLLHEDGMTIRGVQKILREEGVRHVQAMSPPVADFGAPMQEDAEPEAVAAKVLPFREGAGRAAPPRQETPAEVPEAGTQSAAPEEAPEAPAPAAASGTGHATPAQAELWEAPAPQQEPEPRAEAVETAADDAAAAPKPATAEPTVAGTPDTAAEPSRPWADAAAEANAAEPEPEPEWDPEAEHAFAQRADAAEPTVAGTPDTAAEPSRPWADAAAEAVEAEPEPEPEPEAEPEAEDAFAQHAAAAAERPRPVDPAAFPADPEDDDPAFAGPPALDLIGNRRALRARLAAAPAEAAAALARLEALRARMAARTP